MIPKSISSIFYINKNLFIGIMAFLFLLISTQAIVLESVWLALSAVSIFGVYVWRHYLNSQFDEEHYIFAGLAILFGAIGSSLWALAFLPLGFLFGKYKIIAIEIIALIAIHVFLYI